MARQEWTVAAFRIERMSGKAALIRNLRTIHLYIGVFIAPALIFFAFTGALQTFGLQEDSRGGGYKAPHWAVVLGQIHKKQTAMVQVRKPFPAGDAKKALRGDDAAGPGRPQQGGGSGFAPGPPPPAQTTTVRHPLPLKIFFLIVSIGLLLSTVTGIYMALLYKRNAGLIAGLLLAGVAIPIVLLFV